MSIKSYEWSREEEFLGRENELKRLNDWWKDSSREPVNLFGRRRVGKSWLLRKFAHGKPALVLVAENTTSTQQLSKLAEQLENALGFTPAIKDLEDLFRLIFQMAKTKTLIILDEFPYLLGKNPSEISSSLSTVQAAMEKYRDDSKVKIVICGSAVAQMEDLQSERNPLHGRLLPMSLKPLEFSVARQFMPSFDPIEQFTRYSITGGMPRYLSLLSSGSLSSAIANNIVDKDGSLFNETISILQSELRETTVYMAILAVLALKPASVGDLHAGTGVPQTSLIPYLDRLAAINVIRRRKPVGAHEGAKSGQWVCDDDFIRFWFHFVGPYIPDLESGSDATAHVTAHILPRIHNHVSLTFEEIFKRWARQQYPQANNVGTWWGNSLNRLRQAGDRTSEEVDMVGLQDHNIEIVGEAKWTNKVMPVGVLTDLRNYKIPAMNQSGLNTPKPPIIVLTNKSGFSQELIRAAAADATVRLVPAKDILTQVR